MKPRYTLLLIVLFLCVLSCKKSKDPVPGNSGEISEVSPDSSGHLYSFTFKNLFVEINRDTGARISSLKIDGNEFLYVNKASGNNWGSTFWSSPQSVWNWPPPSELDKDAYTTKVIDKVLYAESGISTAVDYSFEKAFSAFRSDTSFLVKYTIENHAHSTKNVAPWEITRVPFGGLTFFPKGTTAPTGNIAASFKDSLDVIWLKTQAGTSISGGKMFSDGAEGWIAHINGDYILVKKWQNISADDAAPGEAEIEIYVDPSNKYIEVENQGAYKPVTAHAKYPWEVKWYARKLPAGINKDKLNTELLNYVRSIVQ